MEPMDLLANPVDSDTVRHPSLHPVTINPSANPKVSRPDLIEAGCSLGLVGCFPLLAIQNTTFHELA
jgi:hypothetical protein